MRILFSAQLEDSAELIQWKIGDTGFEMTLSGEVPGRIQNALQDESVRARLYDGWSPDEVDSWAVHAGGRSILDAVEKGLELPQGAFPMAAIEALMNCSACCRRRAAFPVRAAARLFFRVPSAAGEAASPATPSGCRSRGRAPI